jgi:ectoine hydroxylase-related dioxygenase (phytanoyl-CoA dioxygenase family)
MTLATSISFQQSILSQEQKDLFYEQGYLVLPSVFSENDLIRLRNQCDNLTEAGLRKLPTASQSASQNAQQFTHFEKNSKFVYRYGAQGALGLSHVVGCDGFAPDVAQYLRSTKIIHTFADLMGAVQLQHLLCQFHPKLPGSRIVFHPHRDIDHRIKYAEKAGGRWTDINGHGSYVVGITAIDPMTQRNGGLCAITGSHKDAQELSGGNVSSHDMSVLRSHIGFKAITLKPGDVALLHPNLLHWSGPNCATDQTRYTLITGFCINGANPNQNHQDYAGDSTHYILHVNEKGFKRLTAPWRTTS